MPQPPQFDVAFREKLRALFVWRRDVRKFLPAPLPDGTARRLIEAACLAPSVGLSEPWRFVFVESPQRRTAMQRNFEAANKQAIAGYDGEKARLYATLKLSGMEIAPLQMAVFVDNETEQGKGLGRHSMPETLAYSTVTAIHTLWLAARAEGLGVGWVSILDPLQAHADLDLPDAWRFIAYLCIGFPEIETKNPSLQDAGWENRRDIDTFILTR
jgi:5,6-dimethylbenzimidazole synthase